MNKKTLLAAGIALACTLSVPVFASDTIEFDPDGGELANGTMQVGSLDWAVGSTLSVNSISSDPNDPIAVGDEIDFYSHAALGTTLNPGGTPIAPSGLNTNFEITFIGGFTETVTSVTIGTAVNPGTTDACDQATCEFQATVTFAESATPNVNFFEIYYDDFTSGVQSDALAGTGYDDGLLILSASLVDLSGSFTTTFSFNDLDASGDFSAGDTLNAVLLDQFGDEDWLGQLTVEGEGATTLIADVNFQHTDFFISNISALVQDMFFNTSNIVPFDETNPSNNFDTVAGGNDANDISPTIGAVNGFSGPDFLLQTDANQSFTVTTEVPEPNTVLLFALGLLFLGYGSRNHFLRRS